MLLLDTLHEIGERFLKLFKDPQASSGMTLKDRETFRNIFSNNALSQILPYQFYDKETGVFISDHSLGFIVEAIPLIGANESVQKQFLSIFQEIMEEGSSFQCLLWGDHRINPFLRKWEDARTTDFFRTLAQKRTDFLRNNSSLSPRIFRSFFSYSIPHEGKISSVQLNSLKAVKERLLNLLQSITPAICLDDQRFLDMVEGLVNFNLEPDCSNKKVSSLDLLCNQIPNGGAIGVKNTGLQIKTSTESLFKSFRVVDYPDSWSLGSMQRLIGDFFRESFRIKYPFLLHYGVHCPVQSKEENSFWSKMHLKENQGRSMHLLRMVPELAEELKELDHARRCLSQTDRFVWTQFGVGLWSNLDQSEQAAQSIKSLFRINGFSLAENDYLHLPHFLSFLPLTWGEYYKDLRDLGVLKLSLTSECANLLPIQGEWAGTDSPGILMVGRRGQLMNWSPFGRNGNFNATFVGASGSGKTVLMADILLSSLSTGTKVFILEVGRCFEKMCHMIGGQHIVFTNKTKLCLNPFTHMSDSGDDEDISHSFIMLRNIISVMASPTEKMGHFEMNLISLAIRHAWSEKKNKATITDVALWLENHQDVRAKTLSVMLSSYVKGGVYSKYFEGENNVNFSNPLVLVELEELKDQKDLQTVILQLVIISISNQVFLGDRKTTFQICMDEAWDLLRAEQTVEFIEALARRLRKYNGSLLTGTQSIEDFYRSPGTLAAYDNSDWHCYLAQKKSSIKRLNSGDKIQMDEAQIETLESLSSYTSDYRDVMICAPNGFYSVGRLALDPFSRILYSSLAAEYTEIQELQEIGLDVVQAIDRLLANRREKAKCLSY